MDIIESNNIDIVEFFNLNPFKNDDFQNKQQLHFNQILSQLIDNYQALDNDYASNKGFQNDVVVNKFECNNQFNNEDENKDDDEIIFIEEKFDSKQTNSNYINEDSNSNSNDNYHDVISSNISKKNSIKDSKLLDVDSEEYKKEKEELLKRLNKSLVSTNQIEINTNKNSDDDDDEIYFLCEEEGPQLMDNYFDNDDEVDEKEVMKRWRCKKLSDPKVNLSKSNYRLRLFKEKNAKQAADRKFKQCIFKNQIESQIKINENTSSLDKSISNSPSGRFKIQKKQIPYIGNKIYLDFSLPLSNKGKLKLDTNTATSSKTVEVSESEIEDGEIRDEKNNLKKAKDDESSCKNSENLSDKDILDKRIECIRQKYKELDRKKYLTYREQKQSLINVFNQQKAMLKMFYDQQLLAMNTTDKRIKRQFNKSYQDKQNICQNLFKKALKELLGDFKNECKNIKESENSQIDALKTLFDSGKYEKGKLDQYFTLGLMQPKAKRRRYNDDGHRQVLLPEDKLRNIIIEDTIYTYYYGTPKS